MGIDLKAVVLSMIEIREFCDSQVQNMTEQQQQKLGAFHYYVHCMQLELIEIDKVSPCKN